MSQLADIEQVVTSTSLPREEQAKLFFDLLEALGWELDGVNSAADAEVYLFQLR